MAFQMDIEAADGTVRPGAYWVPVQINIGAADKTGQLTFYAYSSAANMDEGKAPIAGAVKSYTFTPEEFMAAQMMPMSTLFPDGITGNNIMYEVLARFAYYVAQARKDVDSGTVDANGNPVMRSFFEAATHV